MRDDDHVSLWEPQYHPSSWDATNWPPRDHSSLWKGARDLIATPDTVKEFVNHAVSIIQNLRSLFFRQFSCAVSFIHNLRSLFFRQSSCAVSFHTSYYSTCTLGSRIASRGGAGGVRCLCTVTCSARLARGSIRRARWWCRGVSTGLRTRIAGVILSQGWSVGLQSIVNKGWFVKVL